MARLLAGLFALAVIAAGASLLLRPESKAAPNERYRGSAPPAGLSLPAFSLRDAVAGGAVRSGDVQGKVAVVTFLDTRCKEACPIIAGRIASGLRLLSRDERGRVEAVALTVNPRVDTPRHVRAFLAEHRATGLIRYLTGRRTQLAPVWRAFHVQPAIETGDDDIHSADVRVFSADGTWVSTLRSGIDLTPANLAHDVRLALGS